MPTYTVTGIVFVPAHANIEVTADTIEEATKKAKALFDSARYPSRLRSDSVVANSSDDTHPEEFEPLEATQAESQELKTYVVWYRAAYITGWGIYHSCDCLRTAEGVRNYAITSGLLAKVLHKSKDPLEDSEELPEDLRPAVKEGQKIQRLVRLSGGGFQWGSPAKVLRLDTIGNPYIRYPFGKVDKIAEEWRVVG